MWVAYNLCVYITYIYIDIHTYTQRCTCLPCWVEEAGETLGDNVRQRLEKMLHWIYWVFSRGTDGQTISTIVDALKAEIWKHFQWLKHTNISPFELQTERAHVFFFICLKYFKKQKTQVKVYLLLHQKIIPALHSEGHVPLQSHVLPAVLRFRILYGVGNVLVSKCWDFFSLYSLLHAAGLHTSVENRLNIT